uniref:Putative secreted protein n=1 Tax=Anopheles marajoara TaxID=58244 RepID=A0A2M4C6Z2_9DIPT
MCAALCFTVGHCCASSLSVRAVPHSTVLQRHRGGGMTVELKGTDPRLYRIHKTFASLTHASTWTYCGIRWSDESSCLGGGHLGTVAPGKTGPTPNSRSSTRIYGTFHQRASERASERVLSNLLSPL